MRNLLTTALFFSAALASFAFAEEPEIVVTATRTPTPVARLPERVEVIGRSEIEAESLTSLTQAIGAEAVQSGGGGQQASVFLRGANSKHVLALFDGVRLNDASNPNGQYDFGLDTLGGLDRVEVLRGPASSIYGSDALGGVVNLIPRRGGDSAFDPFLEASFGSFDTLRGLAGAAGSMGALDYGISAEMFDTDGYDLVPSRMSTHTGDADGARVDTLTGSARIDMGAVAFDGLARYRTSQTEFDTFSGGAFFDLRADDPDLENKTSQSVWRLGADLAPGRALSFRVSGGQVASDRAETDGGFQTSAAQATQSFIDAIGRYTSGSTTLTAGVAFNRDDIETKPQFANPLSIAEDQKAAYVIGQARFGDHVDATASLRVDDYESFGTHTTYAVGLVGAFDPVRMFVSYATAFKAPSLSERFEQSFFNIGNPDLHPETSSNWEIGADWRALEALTLGGSYHQIRIDDLIDYNFAQVRNVNVGRAEIDGAEAYLEARPVSWGSLRVAYAYTNARNGLTGAQLARRPEQSWRLDARVTPTDRVGLALSWIYVGERTDVTYDDGGNFLSGAGRVAGFNVGSLAATFDLDDRAQVFARVDNISDETYEQPAAFAGAPRAGMIGIRARY